MGLLTNAAIAGTPSLMMAVAGMDPDAWQERVLANRYHRLMLNCARQSGKTTVIACNALDEALYHAPSLTLVLGPAERQSKELIRKIDRIRTALGVSVNPDSQTKTSMEFKTGSRIVALPSTEANIRGISAVSYLIIDEAARVSDELYHAVRPMLATSNGRIALMSTPFGKRGFFFKEWTESNDWHKVMITAEECPRIPKAFLEEERRALPKEWFRQEYFCEFAETTNAVFSFEDIQIAMSDEVQPLILGKDASASSDIQPLMLT